MVALADVRRWDAAAVESAFRALGTVRDRLLTLDDELRTAAPPHSWNGGAADLARASQERLTGRLRRITAGVTALRPPVAEAGDAVTALRRDLHHADSLAAAHGFTIGADGTITDALRTGPAAERRGPARDEIRTLLDGVLRRAAEIDTALSGLLAVAGQVEDGPAGPGPAPPALPGPPRPGAPPRQSTAWWDGLSAAEQNRVVAEHPGWVGNRDGIPAAVRDRANRDLLGTETARLDRALADATRRRASPDGTAGTAGEIERLQGQHDALRAVAGAVAPPGRHLLLLDLSGHDQPRAAVAVGDVDTADHVAVFTPGFTSTVAGSLIGYTEDMAGVQQTAQQLLLQGGRGAERVAAVAWLGYDAPQWNTVMSLDRSVASGVAARQGGADLARFLDGVDASRPGDPHLTALGHSYGSTTTGYALQQAGGVDDAVLFGSPGTGTGDVADLRVPAGHTAVLEARRDVVADLGRFGGDTNQLAGTTDLSAREETGPNGMPLRESVGHSEYLAPGTTSQHNIAATVAGLHEQRITGGNDGLGDLLRRGWDAVR